MLLAVPLILIALVLAVRAYSAASAALNRTNAIDERLHQLESDVQRLSRLAPAVPVPTAPKVARAAAPSSVPPPSPDITTKLPATPSPASLQTAAANVSHPVDQSSTTLESEIGSRWMLIAGVVVLVLGMAFFVKYAFDRHWINETARVGMGTIAGLAVWAAGLTFARRGYAPFGRMVAGAGLAMMFVSAWAATALYGLVPTGVGFVWTVGVGVVAALTADREGSVGLALVAVVFAYAAPFLVPSAADHHRVLFTYEAILAASALILVQRHGWPMLGLASWWSTWTTLFLWLTRSYRDGMFVSTEMYLVFVSSVFVVMMWMYRRRSIDPIARIAAYVLFAGPVLFHMASVYVLFNHSLSFLLYLIIGTAVCVSVVNDRPAVRLLGWVAVALPFLFWIDQHRTAGWYVPALVTTAAIYLLHLWSAVRNFGAQGPQGSTTSPTTAELVLFQFNGLGAFLFAYLMVDAHAGSTSLLAASMAAGYLILAWRFRIGFAAAVPHALATAFTLTAVTIALALTGPWITVAYAAEGAAIIVVGLWSARGFFRYAGMALLAVSAWRLVVLQFARTPVSFTPIVNARTLTGGFIVAMLYFVAWLYRRYGRAFGDEAAQAIVIAVVAANLFTVGLLTADVRSFWLARPDQLTADFSRQLSISITWAAYAMGAIWIGFKRPSSTLRYVALGLFGVTLGKMFTVDLLELDGVYRITGFIGLGLVLLTASFLYQRQRPRASGP